MTKMKHLLLASAALALLSACSDKSESAPAAAPAAPAAPAAAPAAPAAAPAQPADPTAAAAADPAAEAKTLFKTRCVICHGENGKGDGPTAAALNPKPRDYTDAAWQKSITDEQLAKTIVEGGQAVGKSPLMPANPDLKDKPAVVNELVKLIRGFAPKS